MQIKIGIADDHRLMIDCIREVLAGEPDVSVVLEAANGDDLLAHPLLKGIDILFLDMRMPGLSGLSLVQTLRLNYPHIRIIVASMFNDLTLFKHLWQLGVMGFLSKSASGNKDIRTSMQKVRQGEMYLDQKYKHMSAQAFLSSDNQAPSYELSERQLQLVTLFAQGLEAEEISKQLHISKSTVFYERNKVIEALGVATFIEAVSYCIQHGLVERN